MKLKQKWNEKRIMLRTDLIIIFLNMLITIILMLADIHIMYVKGISLGVNITIIIHCVVGLIVDYHNINYAKHNIKTLEEFIERMKNDGIQN